MLTNWLITLGLTRDSMVWLWSRLAAVAALIASGALDIGGVSTYLGLHLPPTGQHWVTAVCVIVLWLSGKMDSSPLPGKAKS